METIKIDRKNTLMVAHRGISGLAKENSLEAFELAGKSTHWGIETDVHVTKDGKYIIHHDDNIKRCTGVDHVIEETDFDTLRNIPLLGMDGEETEVKQYSPTLEEYLLVCKKYNKHIVLELKAAIIKEHCVKIAKVVEDMGLMGQTTFISFHLNNLIYIRKAYKDADIEFLVCNKPWYLKHIMFIALKKYHFSLDIEQNLVTEKLVKRVHRNGLKINVWTVNDKDAAEKLISWGVDQITSNILE